MRAEPEPHADRRAAGECSIGEAGLPGPRIQESLKTNRYAPPKAAVEPAHQVGELWRRGALVRMDRQGALPDRCIVCNADAGGYRLARKLYWAPTAWRIGAAAAPFLVLGIGIVGQSPLFMLLFWPLVIVLLIAHAFVRKKVEIEFGVCPRHRRLRTMVGVISLACAAGVLAMPFLLMERGAMLPILLALVAAVLLLAIFQSRAGVQAISIKRLTGEHAWLARTGKAFRAALPELPG